MALKPSESEPTKPFGSPSHNKPEAHLADITWIKDPNNSPLLNALNLTSELKDFRSRIKTWYIATEHGYPRAVQAMPGGTNSSNTNGVYTVDPLL
ncbi:hypothetical protein LZ554_005891 [Drepanopeziza brunnea f. sp. 'monogermtubi']|nr:hypothetical protein LZ554_005891 [Drepanopeziza brunnea f. sp. 'monogermtubi']